MHMNKGTQNIKTIHQVFTLLYVFLVLCVFKLLLVTLSFSLFRKLYAKLRGSHVENVPYLIFCINGISNYIPFGFTCLPKALTLKYFMSKDTEAKLVVGVKLSNQGLEAHAWVEKAGKFLIGEFTEEQFKPIWEWQ
ncbi:lasso peptide biosynthesis B2 protein [Lacihabitans soyangensis]|uniref:Lasso peptide biosynthesis B2 protein n=1 Tax=Lacihabitans soyangensis TaxID=869394 RepID=A0AAE3H3D5_9BACT|nr:lasso peptide biosynthesis B2 protein [Lacihabitans soyangensis]MCP9764028.1 lasso peptide biosynthesis B2 protein [Lacihabitans soyangensis]